VSNLANGLAAGRGASISERSDVAVTHVAARRGARAALEDAARTAFGAALPSAPRVIEAGELTIVWAGPDQWLFIQKAQAEADPSANLAAAFQGLASVVDVSDSRTLFRVEASRPSQALIRSMGIDFDHDAFMPGDVAITHVSHLGVMVWRLPDGSGYEFACARTYARDFRDWLSKI
jgi:heterotetrameric sarcosine oxidase gamma subunit